MPKGCVGRAHDTASLLLSIKPRTVVRSLIFMIWLFFDFNACCNAIQDTPNVRNCK